MNSINQLIDLTLLNLQANEEDIKNLSLRGAAHQVAALCVYPQHVSFIPVDSPLPKATVLNFPTGDESHSQVLQQLDRIIINKSAQEIDYVIAYSKYLSGHQAIALQQCAEIYKRCKQHQLIFKVILETGALPSSDIIYQLSRAILEQGCDFLKTSTGKIETGATLPAATAMLQAIIDSNSTCGIKLSGGIRSIAQAEQYIRLAETMMKRPVDKSWFRIGCSQVLL